MWGYGDDPPPPASLLPHTTLLPVELPPPDASPYVAPPSVEPPLLPGLVFLPVVQSDQPAPPQPQPPLLPPPPPPPPPPSPPPPPPPPDVPLPDPHAQKKVSASLLDRVNTVGKAMAMKRQLQGAHAKVLGKRSAPAPVSYSARSGRAVQRPKFMGDSQD